MQSLRLFPMMRQALTATSILLALAGLAFAAEEPTLPTGLWAVTFTTETEFAKQPLKRRLSQCITAENNSPIRHLVKDGSCKTTETSNTDGTFRWKVECTKGKSNLSKGQGEFKLEGNTARAVFEMTTQFQGKETTSKATWAGTRIGECTPEKP